MHFRDDPDNHRFVAETDDDAVIGVAVYHLRKGRYFFVHTEVEPEYEGEGVGSSLVRFSLDAVRNLGASVVPLCPFFAAWIDQHSSYQDLVDRETLDQI
jgi:uncharacterized protein